MFSLFQNFTNGTTNIKGCNVFNDGRTVIFSTMDKDREVDNGGVYLPAGCMVPEYGRLALLEGLDMVGERVLMCDTDSIIYMASQNESENIPEGDLLGFFTTKNR